MPPTSAGWTFASAVPRSSWPSLPGTGATAPLRKPHACTLIPSPISCRISLRRDMSTVLETVALMFTGPLRMENSLPETCWTKIHSPAHEKSPAQYGRKTPLVGPRFPGRGRGILSGGQIQGAGGRHQTGSPAAGRGGIQTPAGNGRCTTGPHPGSAPVPPPGRTQSQ